MPRSRLDRFEAKFVPEPNSGCWLWTGGINEHGYGIFWNGERLEKAHRFSYRTAGNELSADLDLLHRCDTPACVNPDHLFTGTAQSNVDDMWAKGRATVQRRRGTAQTQAKLTDAYAADIRRLYAAGRYNQYELAFLYEVSQSIVWKVIHRHLWKEPSGVVIERNRGR